VKAVEEHSKKPQASERACYEDSKGTVPVEGRYVAAGIQGQVCIASMGKVNKLCTEGNVDDSADGRGAES